MIVVLKSVESVRVGQIVDEGSERPCAELHPRRHLNESGGVEHEIRCIDCELPESWLAVDHFADPHTRRRRAQRIRERRR